MIEQNKAASSASGSLTKFYETRLMSVAYKEKDEAVQIWHYRTLKLFYAAIEVAKSKLLEGDCLSEDLIVESSALASLEAYGIDNQVGGRVWRYLHELPGYHYRDEGRGQVVANHGFAELALKEFLLNSDNDLPKKVFEANYLFIERCRERIGRMGITNHVSREWVRLARHLMGVAMEIIQENKSPEHYISMVDIHAALELSEMDKYCLSRPDSINTANYLDSLPGLIRGEAPEEQAIQAHRSTMIGIRNLLGR